LFGTLFLVPFYMERILGENPAGAGLVVAAVALPGVLGPIAGWLADKKGPRLPTVAGMGIAAVALSGLALIQTPSAQLASLLLVIVGAGFVLFLPANSSAVMSSAPVERIGSVSGLLNIARSMGPGLGVAATGAVLAARVQAHVGGHVERTLDVPPDLLQGALQETFLFLVMLLLSAAVLAAFAGPSATKTNR
jgi:MFS family permease